MYRFPALAIILLLSGLPLTAGAIDKSEVRKRWHTPFDLYLSAQEAYAMKTTRPDEVLFIDVADLDQDGWLDVVSATAGHRLLVHRRTQFDPPAWSPSEIVLPDTLGTGSDGIVHVRGLFDIGHNLQAGYRITRLQVLAAGRKRGLIAG